MSSNNALRNAVRHALCVSAIAAASTYASTALAADDDRTEEVTVTGTRLIRQDYQAASPISTVDAELFADTGAPTIETVLNTLPQFVPALTSTSNNPSNGGQANVSLRGLGTSRTLVLLDGRRVVPSNPTGVVDLNLIPASLIENVEVITGGASAVYGSDAVAGVVNIRTRHFKGLEMTANHGQTAESDGGRTSFGLTGGVESESGGGYAMATFNWADREEVLQGSRPFSSVSLDWDGDSFEPLGSSTIRQGRWDAIGSNAPTQAAVDAYFGALDPSYVPGTVSRTRNFGFNPDGSIFSTGGSVASPVVNFTGDMNEPLQPVNPVSYTYNFAPPNYLELPLRRKSFFGKAGLEISDDLNVYSQALWGNYLVDSALAPTPATSLYVSPTNPNLDPGVAALLATRPDPTAPFRIRKRMIEAGPRLRSIEYDVAQFIAGAFGNLWVGESWTWDAYASWGSVSSNETQAGNISRSAFYALSLAADHGASVCGSAINPFGINSIQAQCVPAFTRSAINTENVDQTVIEGFVRGNAFEMPAGTVQTAFGVMYKNDDYAFLPDAVLTANTTDPFTGSTIVDITGFNAQLPVRGKIDSTEFYMEANFPLLADAAAANHLDLTVGARFTDHSSAGNMTSYKAESIWDINDNFTLRGGFQRALRAPNISELFRPATINFPSVGLGDPCSNDFDAAGGTVLGAQDDPRARALCVAQGIPDGVIDGYVYTNNQFQGLSGGNPLLGEESADTYTVGVVFNGPDDGPLSGFQGAIDFYSISIEDGVGSIDADVFIERCFDPTFNQGLANNSFYCNFFQRDVGTGTIINALEVDTNIAETEVEGIDFQIEYSTDIGPGQLDIKWLATNLLDWKQAQISGETLEQFAGTASGSFDVLPDWKFTTSFGYSVNNFDGNLRWRHVGETKDDSFPDFKLDSVEYLDLTLGYRFTGDRLAGLAIRGGITNMTDEQPLIYPSNQQANTDPSTYDVLGRRYFVTASYRFNK